MNMKIKYFSILVIMLTLVSWRDNRPAYIVYQNDGDKSSYNKMLKELSKADMVFFGELHDVSIAHWLELVIAEDLFAERGAKMVVGAEMFESDNQLLLDELLSGVSSLKNFDEQARLWKNYPTDYKPVLSFALINKLKFIATNVPRRYASLVSKKGFESLNNLSAEAKSYLAPLPIVFDSTVACYKNMLDQKNMGHMTTNIVRAQALKDATMAHFILKNFSKGQLFYHFNGSYHSDHHEGIVWYIKNQQPGLNIKTVSVVTQKDIEKVDSANLKVADFIIVVPENMTKTY